MSAGLVLGPLLRYVGVDEATVWAELDGACEVEVLGHRAPTFCVEGHHYALVQLTGLAPASTTPYELSVDGRRLWPEPGSQFPASVIRTTAPGEPVRLVFGSCRVCVPHEPPFSLSKDADERGREVDVLRAYAQRMRGQDPSQWPHALLLLGDQVYADEASPETCAFIRSRRDQDEPPGETIADFEEYTRLYREAWSEPVMRWLLSTVSSAMIFDDHDIHDDWNTSVEWVAEMRAQPWWDARIEGGLMAYWVYQHLGNMAPEQLATDPLYAAVRDCGDAGSLLRDFAHRADRTTDGARWSYCRDLGSARLVMVDSRAGRVLEHEHRSMLDEQEWKWVHEHARGDCDHLLIGTSLPLLMAPGMQYLEAWNEQVCAGAWGRPGRLVGERLREALDLEHWGAFSSSFERMCRLLRDVGAGRRGRAPASIVALSGDVHHAYLAEVAFPREQGVRSAVWQAVCSPLRNPLNDRERRVVRFGASRAGAVVGRLLARSAGVPDPPVRWRYVHDEPWFDNQLATLELHGRHGRMRLERIKAEGEDDSTGDGSPRLEQVFEHALAEGTPWPAAA